MAEKTLGAQGLALSPETLAIILDFSRNVKGKELQKMEKKLRTPCIISRYEGGGEPEGRGDSAGFTT